MGLFDDLIKKFVSDSSNQTPTTRTPTQPIKVERKKPEREKTGRTETTSAASESEKTSKENSSNGKDKKGYTAPTADSTIVIEYLNFEGDLKQFIGDPKSIRRKGNHFSVRVAPTFKRISLNRSKTRILKGMAAPAPVSYTHLTLPTKA